MNKRFVAKLNPQLCDQEYWTVFKTEEKGSDVNLAVHLLNDAWEDKFDVALVFSNDSDIAEAVRLATGRGKTVLVIVESRQNVSSKLSEVASSVHRFGKGTIALCQLPDIVETKSGVKLTKPLMWF